MAEPDWEAVRYALDLARQGGFAELELEFSGTRFTARMEPASNGQATSQLAKVEEAAQDPIEPAGVIAIEAPCVGYYKASGTPLEPGKHVSAGEVVASIAALGLANDVPSPLDGEVVDVLVRDGDVVEFGQPIARVKVTG